MKDLKIRKAYPASKFCDCREMSLTAKDKAGIVADWERFVVWRFDNADEWMNLTTPRDSMPRQWTERLYQAFVTLFTYPASVNRRVFWEYRLQHVASFRRTLHQAAIQHTAYWRNAKHMDLNRAMGHVSAAYMEIWDNYNTARESIRQREALEEQAEHLRANGYTVIKN